MASVRFRATYGVDPSGEGFYWPASRQKRREYFQIRRGQPQVAEVVYQGNPEALEGAVFSASDFRPYVPPPGLAMGLASPDVRAWLTGFLGKGGGVVEAWDTAFGQSSASAKTVALAGLLIPCRHWHFLEDEDVVGKPDFHYDVMLLDAMVENLDFGKLALAFRARHSKWGANPVIVEEKASGISLIQTFRNTGIPVRGQKVADGKVERAVNGVGGGPYSVQGWCRLGRVHYPVGEPWVDPFLARVFEFAGEKTGRADEFDTLVHLVTHAIVKSVRTAMMPSQAGTPEPMEPATPPELTPAIGAKRRVLDAIAAMGPGGGVNPFEGMCGAPCRHFAVAHNREWCAHHNRPTTAMFGCDRWERS